MAEGQKGGLGSREETRFFYSIPKGARKRKAPGRNEAIHFFCGGSPRRENPTLFLSELPACWTVAMGKLFLGVFPIVIFGERNQKIIDKYFVKAYTVDNFFIDGSCGFALQMDRFSDNDGDGISSGRGLGRNNRDRFRELEESGLRGKASAAELKNEIHPGIDDRFFLRGILSCR